MTLRALVFVAALLSAIAGLPEPARAEEAFIVTLTDPSDATNWAEVRCAEFHPCTAPFPLKIGNTTIVLTFVMEALPPSLYVRTVDWREEEWHFDLVRDGGGAFGSGDALGTLWLRWIGGVQNPVLRRPEGMAVGRIRVSFVRETARR